MVRKAGQVHITLQQPMLFDKAVTVRRPFSRPKLFGKAVTGRHPFSRPMLFDKAVTGRHPFSCHELNLEGLRRLSFWEQCRSPHCLYGHSTGPHIVSPNTVSAPALRTVHFQTIQRVARILDSSSCAPQNDRGRGAPRNDGGMGRQNANEGVSSRTLPLSFRSPLLSFRIPLLSFRTE